ncbi:hypothetical protein BF14_005800 [Streptomyces griseus]|uniref:ABC transporter permease n=1 Tax=Streptomyces globisporus TaxID=1908 RepID=UPI0005C86067|nr:ABC-2 family transporter protein [Streptomyces globisporus]AWL85508.1 hypothetical protein DIJ69_05780 [Streptomyces globisporus]PPA39306.1 hypothetical protein BF14_005800 [Streptomyces griseus]RAN16691.1 hypothetical protein A3838_05670 [Streptomyces badius]RAN24559.1 hypothetical protein A3800_05665 [Streptomyces badius]
MRTARTAWILERAAIRAQMQYKANFISMTLLGIIYQASAFSFVAIVMYNSGVIGGWVFEEICSLYGLRLLAHSLSILPLSHLWTLDSMVREAEFDRYLLRPMSPFLQFLTSKFQMSAAGDLLVASIILGYAFPRVDIDFSPATVTFLMAGVAGGALVEASIQVAVASLVFRTLNTMSFRIFVDTIFNLTGNYPLTIFSGFVQSFLIAIPISFVAYFPAVVALGKEGELNVPLWVAFLTLPIGLLFSLCAAMTWKSQMRHYQSAGH